MPCILQLDRSKTSHEPESCALPTLLAPEFGVNFNFLSLVDCFGDKGGVCNVFRV